MRPANAIAEHHPYRNLIATPAHAVTSRPKHNGLIVARSGETCISALALLLCLGCLTPKLSAQQPRPAPVPLPDRMEMRLLTPVVNIHAEDDPDPPGLTPIQRAMHQGNKIFGDMVSVTLEVVVNENGRVDSAKPTGGPEKFYAQAQEIEMHHAFEPVRIDGQIRRVEFTDYVRVYPQERWESAHVALPEAPYMRSVNISLERTGCLGSCPSYKVTLSGDGDITFVAPDRPYAFVTVPGIHHARVSSDTMRELWNSFRRADFLSAQNDYTCNWTDMPSQTLTLTFGKVTKQVHDYGGLVVGLPEAIGHLEAAVDEAADTARWVRGNDNTLASLRAEHWNFARNDATNLTLYDNAIDRKLTPLIEAFIAARTPIVSTAKDTPSPICAASASGDIDLLDRMLVSPAKASILPLQIRYTCLSMAATSGALPVVDFWLDHHAPTNFNVKKAADDERDDGISASPMMSAIHSENVEIAHTLLQHGASVSLKDNDNHSLLSQAVDLDDDDHPGAAIAIIKLLLTAGEDPNEEDQWNRPPLFMVDSVEIAQLLIRAGAKVNRRDSTGGTALMYAFDPEIAKLLLESGADPTLRDKEGKSALDHAREFGRKDSAALIQSALDAQIGLHRTEGSGKNPPESESTSTQPHP